VRELWYIRVGAWFSSVTIFKLYMNAFQNMTHLERYCGGTPTTV